MAWIEEAIGSLMLAYRGQDLTHIEHKPPDGRNELISMRSVTVQDAALVGSLVKALLEELGGAPFLKRHSCQMAKWPAFWLWGIGFLAFLRRFQVRSATPGQ